MKPLQICILAVLCTITDFAFSQRVDVHVSPSAVVTKFFDSVFKGRYQTAYQLLSDESKSKSVLNVLPKGELPIDTAFVANDIRVVATDENIDGSSAVVSIKFIVPDFAAELITVDGEAAIREYLAGTLTTGEVRVVLRNLSDLRGGVRFTEVKQDFDLVLEMGRWRLDNIDDTAFATYAPE